MSAIIRVIPQRHPADCGVACLAMFLGVSYEDALLAVGAVEKRVLKRGLWTSQIKAAAKRLGTKLRTVRGYDVENDSGILGMRGGKKWEFMEHCVVLSHGMIFDTDGSVWEPELYVSANGVKLLSLLVRDGDEGEA